MKKSTENRALAELPVFDINHLNPFPDLYEEYYNDNFTLRNNYNRYYNYFRFRFFNINPFPDKVILGNDNWMFYKNTILSGSESNKQFSESELEDIAYELNSRKKYLSDHNCLFYIGIIPSKASVYYNKLNKQYNNTQLGTIQSRASQLVTYLNNTSDINIINFNEVLNSNKDKYQVYRKYDHHWNSMGGFFVSRDMLDLIQEDIPESDISISLDNYEIKYETQIGGDLAMILGIEEFCNELKPIFHPKENIKRPKKGKSKGYTIPENFAYGWGYEVRKTTNNTNLRNCMIIRDSFGSYFSNFLSRGFNNTFFLWDEWRYEINKELFLQENPDVFIIMIPEADLLKLKNKSS